MKKALGIAAASSNVANGVNVAGGNRNVFGVAAVQQLTDCLASPASAVIARQAIFASIAGDRRIEEDAGSGRDCRDIRSEPDDCPGRVDTRDQRQRPEQPGSQPYVGVIDGRRADLHQHLARRRNRVGPVAMDQLLRPPRRSHEYCLHDNPSGGRNTGCQ